MSIERLETWFVERLGIQPDRAMRHRLRQLVLDDAAARHLDVDTYAALLRRDGAVREALVDRLVVPTTAFFRHPEHFAALRAALPDWPGPVTVWSAGCSTGAEPYTVAMVLREAGVRDWQVVGSDVSAAALQRAAAGRYGDAEVAGLDAERRRRHLERCEGAWQVVPALRERMVFLRHNLAVDDVPAPARRARAVFCRNVMIYLDPAVQRALLDRLDDQVPKLELLFLGATESLWGSDRPLPSGAVGGGVRVPSGAPDAAGGAGAEGGGAAGGAAAGGGSRPGGGG